MICKHYVFSVLPCACNKVTICFAPIGVKVKHFIRISGLREAKKLTHRIRSSPVGKNAWCAFGNMSIFSPLGCVHRNSKRKTKLNKKSCFWTWTRTDQNCLYIHVQPSSIRQTVAKRTCHPGFKMKCIVLNNISHTSRNLFISFMWGVFRILISTLSLTILLL